MTDDYPEIGSIWRSRDPRDDGLKVEVLDVANGFVRIQRFRKTNVSLQRFHKNYEPAARVLPLWRVWFLGGNHADVRADNGVDAKRGPWNPSYGIVMSVEKIEEGRYQ